MQAVEMWERFTKECGEELGEMDAWAFGDDPDTLAELVVNGEKTGTSSAYELYFLEGEPLPAENTYSVILDSRGEARCVIKTTRVYVVRFDEVSEEHARREGEGNKSLAYWKNIHERFFGREFEKAGIIFDEKAKIVCEEFEVVYK